MTSSILWLVNYYSIIWLLVLLLSDCMIIMIIQWRLQYFNIMLILHWPQYIFIRNVWKIVFFPDIILEDNSVFRAHIEAKAVPVREFEQVEIGDGYCKYAVREIEQVRDCEGWQVRQVE